MWENEFEEDGPPAGNFLKVCLSISRMVRLEKLELELSMRERQVNDIFRSSETPLWIMGIQSPSISKEFKLSLSVEPTEEVNWNDPESVEEWEVVEREYERTMKNMLCPCSLRSRPLDQMTDIERYMTTRL